MWSLFFSPNSIDFLLSTSPPQHHSKTARRRGWCGRAWPERAAQVAGAGTREQGRARWRSPRGRAGPAHKRGFVGESAGKTSSGRRASRRARGSRPASAARGGQFVSAGECVVACASTRGGRRVSSHGGWRRAGAAAQGSM